MPKLEFNKINVSSADIKGNVAGNCVARAISLTAGLPYHQVAKDINECLSNARMNDRFSASWGVPTDNFRVQNLLKELGFKKVHGYEGVHLDDLPPGKWMVQVHRHMTVVKGGKIHDTWDPRTKVAQSRVKQVYVHEGYTGLSR